MKTACLLSCLVAGSDVGETRKFSTAAGEYKHFDNGHDLNVDFISYLAAKKSAAKKSAAKSNAQKFKQGSASQRFKIGPNAPKKSAPPKKKKSSPQKKSESAPQEGSESQSCREHWFPLAAISPHTGCIKFGSGPEVHYWYNGLLCLDLETGEVEFKKVGDVGGYFLCNEHPTASEEGEYLPPLNKVVFSQSYDCVTFGTGPRVNAWTQFDEYGVSEKYYPVGKTPDEAEEYLPPLILAGRPSQCKALVVV